MWELLFFNLQIEKLCYNIFLVILMDQELLKSFINLLFIKTKKSSSISANINGDEDIFYRMLADAYDKENNILLDIDKEENKDIIYNWALDKWRFLALNELLNLAINRLIYKEQVSDIEIDNTDEFLYNNFSSLLLIMVDQFGICLKNSDVPGREFSPISINTKNLYIRELFEKIDPSLTWYNIYLEALANNRIIIINDLDVQQKDNLVKKIGIPDLSKLENFVAKIDDGYYIFLTLNYNVSDIPTFFHEFAHYISSIKKEQNIPLTLKEFSSCFYELVALSFLKAKGISEDELLAINANRLKNSASLIMQNISLVNYLKSYLEKGQITYEDEYQSNLDAIKNLTSWFTQEDIDKILEADPDFLNIDKLVKTKCDNCITNLILYPFGLYETYPYIIGNYLAVQMIKILSDDTLAFMKNCTELVDSIDPYDIFEKIEKVENLKLKRVLN